MDVHVHEAGQHAHALGVDDGRARRDRDLAARPHGHDAVAGDEDDAVLDGRALVAVDDLAADEGQRRLGRSLGRGRRGRAGAAAAGRARASVIATRASFMGAKASAAPRSGQSPLPGGP